MDHDSWTVRWQVTWRWTHTWKPEFIAGLLMNAIFVVAAILAGFPTLAAIGGIGLGHLLTLHAFLSGHFVMEDGTTWGAVEDDHD